MTRAGIKEYHVLLTNANKLPADDTDKTQEKDIYALKLLNSTAYNELVLTQEDTVCFQMVE